MSSNNPKGLLWQLKESKKTLTRPYSQLKPTRSKNLTRALSDLKPISNHPANIYRAKIHQNNPRGKTRPIFIDKEQLYEENLNLKQMFNSSEEENRRLKTRLAQLSREFEKSQQDSMRTSGQEKNYKRLVEGLKISIRDLKSQLAAKTKEVDNLKTSLKYTKLNETQELLQQYENECLRLKSFIEHLLKGSTAENAQEEFARSNMLANQPDLTQQARTNDFEMYNDAIEEEDSYHASSNEKHTPNRQLFDDDEEDSTERPQAHEVMGFLTKVEQYLKSNAIDCEDWAVSVSTNGIIGRDVLQDYFRGTALTDKEILAFFKRYGENDRQILISVLVNELNKVTQDIPIIEMNASYSVPEDVSTVMLELVAFLAARRIQDVERFLHEHIDHKLYTEKSLELVFQKFIENQHDRLVLTGFLMKGEGEIQGDYVCKAIVELLEHWEFVYPDPVQMIAAIQFSHETLIKLIAEMSEGHSAPLTTILRVLEDNSIINTSAEKLWMMGHCYSLCQSVQKVPFLNAIHSLVEQDQRSLHSSSRTDQDDPSSRDTKQCPSSPDSQEEVQNRNLFDHSLSGSESDLSAQHDEIEKIFKKNKPAEADEDRYSQPSNQSARSERDSPRSSDLRQKETFKEDSGLEQRYSSDDKEICDEIKQARNSYSSSRKSSVSDKNSRKSSVSDKNSRKSSDSEQNSRKSSDSEQNSRKSSVSDKNSRKSSICEQNSRKSSDSEQNSRKSNISEQNSRKSSVSENNSRKSSVSDKNSRKSSVSEQNLKKNDTLEEMVEERNESGNSLKKNDSLEEKLKSNEVPSENLEKTESLQEKQEEDKITENLLEKENASEKSSDKSNASVKSKDNSASEKSSNRSDKSEKSVDESDSTPKRINSDKIDEKEVISDETAKEEPEKEVELQEETENKKNSLESIAESKEKDEYSEDRNSEKYEIEIFEDPLNHKR